MNLLYSKNRQQGFGLVELMIALVIGLIIVLGAGQLFLTGFQSFKKIEDLGIKQSTLTFAADVLLRDIRRADQDTIVPGDSTLELDINEESFIYSISEGGRGWSLLLDGEPVVDGLKEDENSFAVDPLGNGVYEVTLILYERGVEEGVEVVFRAVNRTEALN